MIIDIISSKIFRKPLFQKCYSQCGEDIIIKFIFDDLGIRQSSYIDIGAYHPKKLSNTQLLYENGSRGINIEPNIELFKKFQKFRKKDINLNIGVAAQKNEMNFYVMSVPTMSTFSKKEATELVAKHNFKIITIKKIKVDTIKNIIDNYWGGTFPELLTIDVEGLEEEILRSIDYKNNFPIVVCIETISYSTTGRGIKDNNFIKFLVNKDYMIFADTYINTILVRKDLWKR